MLLVWSRAYSSHTHHCLPPRWAEMRMCVCVCQWGLPMSLLVSVYAFLYRCTDARAVQEVYIVKAYTCFSISCTRSTNTREQLDVHAQNGFKQAYVLTHTYADWCSGPCHAVTVWCGWEQGEGLPRCIYIILALPNIVAKYAVYYTVCLVWQDIFVWLCSRAVHVGSCVTLASQGKVRRVGKGRGGKGRRGKGRRGCLHGASPWLHSPLTWFALTLNHAHFNRAGCVWAGHRACASQSTRQWVRVFAQ